MFRIASILMIVVVLSCRAGAAATVHLQAGVGARPVQALGGIPASDGVFVKLGSFPTGFDFQLHKTNAPVLLSAWTEWGYTVVRSIFGEAGRFAQSIHADNAGMGGRRAFLWILKTRDGSMPTPDLSNVEEHGIFSSRSGKWVLPSGSELPPNNARFFSTSELDQALLGSISESRLILVPAFAQGLEADVMPRPDGDGKVTVADWVMVGRFAAGLEIPANGAEFQRADCAIFNSFGDGRLTVADWTIAGRYAAGLDPIVPAAGLIEPASEFSPASFRPNLGVAGRDAPTLLQIGNAKVQPAQTFKVPVLFAGNRAHACGFSFEFDPLHVEFVGAVVGEGASGGVLVVNDLDSGSGRVGVVLSSRPGMTFQGALPLLYLEFRAGSQRLRGGIEFSRKPVALEVVDENAVSIPFVVKGGLIEIEGGRGIVARIRQATNGGPTLEWESVPGNRYAVFCKTDLNEPSWRLISEFTSKSSLSTFVISHSDNQQFFRVELLETMVPNNRISR